MSGLSVCSAMPLPPSRPAAGSSGDSCGGGTGAVRACLGTGPDERGGGATGNASRAQSVGWSRGPRRNARNTTRGTDRATLGDGRAWLAGVAHRGCGRANGTLHAAVVRARACPSLGIREIALTGLQLVCLS